MSIAANSMTIRTARVRGGSFDDETRSVEAVLATDDVVTAFDLADWQPVDEVLVMDGMTPATQVPLVDSHPQKRRGEIISADVHGSVRNIRVEGGELLGRLFFADDPESVSLWRKVRGRHIRDLSIGTMAIRQTVVPRGTSQAIGGRTFTASDTRDLLITAAWELGEVSLTPRGADPKAKIRTSTKETMMIRAQQTWNRFFSERQNIRAASTGEGVNALANVIGATILAGYRAAPDSTQGWCREVALPNFKPTPVAAPQSASRLLLHGRGGTAKAQVLRLSVGEWQLSRYSLQFELHEEDLRDAQQLDLLQVALHQIGQATAALRPDLVYSLILENPELSDEVALFHASRSNIGNGGSFDSTPLAGGMKAIGEQTLPDERGDGVHQNLIPKYLVVPPGAAHFKAREIARALQLGDADDLVVRSESRLSTIPFVNPRNDEELIAGTGWNWLLACDQSQAASVLVGHLDGRKEPMISHWALDKGQRGIGIDVTFDVGVKAVDGRPLFLGGSGS